MENVSREQLTREFNFNLLARHDARIVGDALVVDIFRGSDMRRNKHKVAEVRLPLPQAVDALREENILSVVLKAESELNIPLIADKSVW